MHTQYHRQITEEALQGLFSPETLRVVIEANLHQDGLLGQIGHPEYHFDDNALDAGRAYMQRQREIIRDTLHRCWQFPETADLSESWKAFGRLIHAGQDFYSHTNYIQLWLNSKQPSPPPEATDPLDPAVIQHSELRSGRFTLLEAVGHLLPFLRDTIASRLPEDTHYWMNLDSPERGMLFDYVVCAARKRTRHELKQLEQMVGSTFGAHTWQRFTQIDADNKYPVVY
jgi:hypothetical protein